MATRKTKLKAKRVKAWIEALESGKYRRTEDALTDGYGAYCALGVACKVYEKETGNKMQPFDWGNNDRYDHLKEYNDDKVLPERIAKWYGLERNPKLCILYNGKVECDKVSELNDALGASFRTIANGLKTLLNKVRA